MYQLEYSLSEALSDYLQLISNYPAFYYVLLATVIFGVLIYINLDLKISFYITLLSSIALTCLTFYFRGLEMFNHLDSIFTWYFYQNIYFYYWNMIIAFIVMHTVLNSSKQTKCTKVIILPTYVILLTNLIFSFYITGSMRNMYLLVLGNISPMIAVGNLIALIMYIYLIVLRIRVFIKQKQSGEPKKKLTLLRKRS